MTAAQDLLEGLAASGLLLRGTDGSKGDKGDPGPKGDKGDKGDRGDKGHDGTNGADGAKGDKGEKGNKGDAGVDGVGPDEKVKLSSSDPKAGFLRDKLEAGRGIYLIQRDGEKGERLVIEAAATGAVIGVAGGGGGGGGGAPSGAAGGDLSGTYPNPSVVDDSHSHGAGTAPGGGSSGIPTTDTLIGDGIAATFALSQTPSGTWAIVAVNGSVLLPSEFSISGSDIIFDTAPADDAEVTVSFVYDGNLSGVSAGDVAVDPTVAGQTNVQDALEAVGRVVVESVVVSSAQILDMHNTGVEITSTPAVGKMIWPLSMSFKYNFVTTPYTLPPDPHIYISTIQEWTIESNGGYWWAQVTAGLLAFNISTVCPNTMGSGESDDVSVAGGNGHALAAFSQGPGSAFTDGDGTLTITTAYVVIDV